MGSTCSFDNMQVFLYIKHLYYTTYFYGSVAKSSINCPEQHWYPSKHCAFLSAPRSKEFGKSCPEVNGIPLSVELRPSYQATQDTPQISPSTSHCFSKWNHYPLPPHGRLTHRTHVLCSSSCPTSLPPILNSCPLICFSFKVHLKFHTFLLSSHLQSDISTLLPLSPLSLCALFLKLLI